MPFRTIWSNLLMFLLIQQSVQQLEENDEAASGRTKEGPSYNKVSEAGRHRTRKNGGRVNGIQEVTGSIPVSSTNHNHNPHDLT
jgi:hypothetical protein